MRETTARCHFFTDEDYGFYDTLSLQKCGNALEKWGFGQYWHESFLICDNFALIRDNTTYLLHNSLYIEETYILNVIFVNYLT